MNFDKFFKIIKSDLIDFLKFLAISLLGVANIAMVYFACIFVYVLLFGRAEPKMPDAFLVMIISIAGGAFLANWEYTVYKRLNDDK